MSLLDAIKKLAVPGRIDREHIFGTVISSALTAPMALFIFVVIPGFLLNADIEKHSFGVVSFLLIPLYAIGFPVAIFGILIAMPFLFFLENAGRLTGFATVGVAVVMVGLYALIASALLTTINVMNITGNVSLFIVPAVITGYIFWLNGVKLTAIEEVA